MTDTPDLELDCRGMRCPQPVIELAQRMAGLVPGTLVAVLTTDAAARTDIAAWCRLRGHEYVASTALDPHVTRHVVRRLA